MLTTSNVDPTCELRATPRPPAPDGLIDTGKSSGTAPGCQRAAYLSVVMATLRPLVATVRVNGRKDRSGNHLNPSVK
jgi:hypothetical protein